MAGIAAETLAAAALPFDEALRFFGDKVNIPTKTWTDLWEGAHARAFSVAGATSEALLSDFRGAIAKALKDGTTLDTFRQDFDQIVKSHGWEYRGTPGWRARIIYETNLNMAFAAGRYEQMTSAVNRAVFPFWTYRHSGNPHPRLQHKAWDGLTLSVDDSFWLTNYPPNGFHCGCWVEPQMRADLKRMGKSGPDTAPDTTPVYKVTKDGQIKRAPMGVDPGFAYNVGEAWKQKTGLPIARGMRAEPIPPAPALAKQWPKPPETRTETEAAVSMMDGHFGHWGRGLTAGEAGVLTDYKAAGFVQINRALRGQEPNSVAIAQARVLDHALARAPAMPEDVVLFRGIAHDVVAKFRTGRIFREDGFMSTSLSRAKARVFAKDDPPGRVVTIRVPKGYKGVAFVHPYPLIDHNEYEMLFRPGSRFKVISVDPDEIVVEALDEPHRRSRISAR